MADQITATPSRALDWAGDIVPGALLHTYLTGTTTPVTVFQDSAGTIPHLNPIEADDDGIFPQFFYSGTLKLIATDPDGVVLPGYPLDPAPRTLVGTSGAAAVTFSPTAEIPVTDVQEAIERVQDNQATALADAGVGVTQAPLLSNINATNIPSGRYRYDDTTTGLFPAAVTKAETGTVVVSSGATGNQSMQLTPRNGDMTFQRVMFALVWFAWDEIVVASQSATQGSLIIRGASNFTVLPKGGAGQVARATASTVEFGGILTSATVQTTTSGTSFTFLVPTTASTILITGLDVSLSGTDNILVRLGTGGAAVTTGYTSYSRAGSSANVTSSAGMILSMGAAPRFFSGHALLQKHTGNTWTGRHDGAIEATGSDYVTGFGSIALAGAIDRVVITRTGTDTFDAGSINVHYS